MSKLLKYARRSSLMDIDIKWQGERFRYNLYRETVINSDQITKEALLQPSSYAFLSLLHKKLTKKVAELETQEKRAYAQAYVRIKSKNSPKTGRPYSDDLAKEKAILDKTYIQAEDMLNAAKADEGLIFACVKSFEQRQQMIQTISANTRREV